jgi:hypothetical protein
MRLAATLAAAVLALAVHAAAGARKHADPPCELPAASPASAAQIQAVLRSGRDVWGEELLDRPEGPTYAGARRYLPPLLYARAAGKTRLTASGMHYVAFSHPTGVQGAQSVALHVADGSQILAQRADGRRLTVTVGGRPYGACHARQGLPRLAGGFLPILQTSYVDAVGVRYSQESFAARRPGSPALVSFVRLTADARRATRGTTLRFTGPAGAVVASVARGGVATVHVAWPLASLRPRRIARPDYTAARRDVTVYWRNRLAEGARFVVPERAVMDAQRALVVQSLGLTWRYSLGNPYEQFSFPEGIDVAQMLDTYGFDDVARAVLRTSLTRRPLPYPNWKIGQKLVGSALHYRLFRDRAYLDAVTPTLSGYIAELERQLDESRNGLLNRERFSSDIPDSVYGLHSQAVALQGIRWMGQAWAASGHVGLAARCRRLAARLERGVSAAMRASQLRLPDGSLFLPVRLLDHGRPYDQLVASRAGSYWNLVAPYALASGLVKPGSPEAEGALRYLLLHGSRLLGLVRAGSYALYGPDAPFPTSGTDQVYGLNVSRFLAANDRPDLLVLSLYGQLAAGMTPGTFVAGEAASVTPLPGAAARSMYLPPNGAANASFLGTLRLLLLHERVDAIGRPVGLELAYATPRAWLAAGKRISVRDAPTSFGPLSYSIRSSRRHVRVSVAVPRRPGLQTLRLRLRLPRGDRIESVTVDGRRVAVRGATIELPPLPGRHELVARVER